MQRIKRILAVVAICIPSTMAHAQVSLNSARVTSEDTDSLARFYKSAFGMHEVQRLPMGSGGSEIMLNFGTSEEDAMANPAAQVVLMPRPAGEEPDGVAHIIFNVTDMDATVAAVKAAGGIMDREPFGFGNTGILIGMGIDPAGNHFELLYFPPE